MKLISIGDHVIVLNWLSEKFSVPDYEEYHFPPHEYEEDIGKEFVVSDIRDGDNGDWYVMKGTDRCYHEAEIELSFTEECQIVKISSVDELF